VAFRSLQTVQEKQAAGGTGRDDFDGSTRTQVKAERTFKRGL